MIKDGILNSTEKDIVSFLMIGQSNMAGRGDFYEVEPIKNEKCFMLRMGRWQTMSEPINPDRAVFDSKFHSGVGLAASFADEVAKNFDIKVGLIPCADGGTKICQWQPGEVLYDHALAMAKLAMRNSKLGGIIWHQGESDCHNFCPEEYEQMFLNLMRTLRRELDAENVPIIIGEISESISANWKVYDNPPKMNLLLHKLKDKLPLCDIVLAKDLALKEDGIHFTSASYRELGKRYFEKYKKVLQNKDF